MEIREIKIASRNSLKGRRGMAIGAWIVAGIIPWALINFITPVLGSMFGSFIEMVLDIAINILLAGVLVAGLNWLFLGIVDNKNEEFGNLFDGFKHYGKLVKLTFAVSIYIAFWALLFLVPILIVVLIIATGFSDRIGEFAVVAGTIVGLVSSFLARWTVGLRYALVNYLVKDYPAITSKAAIDESIDLMEGRKMKYFLLNLHFFMWYVPSIILFIIGLIPFVRLAFEIIDEIYHGFFTSLMAIEDMIHYVVTDSIGSILVGLALLIIAGIYHIGISFYVAPNRHAANAMFYRSISDEVSDGIKRNFSNAEYVEPFVFADNTPPKEVPTRLQLENERMRIEEELRIKIKEIIINSAVATDRFDYEEIPIIWTTEGIKTVILAPHTGEELTVLIHEVENYFPPKEEFENEKVNFGGDDDV